MTNRINILSLSEVTTRLHEKLDDIPAMAKRYHNGSIDEYYDTLLAETSSEILNVPVDRMCLGLVPLEDEDEAEDEIEIMVAMIADFFNKDHDDVSTDMAESVRIDAERDLRIARLNKFANRLH